MLYSLAPEHPFPAAVNEAVAVYQELLKTYKPQNIGIYGTSAGAILTGEAASCMWGGGEVGQDRFNEDGGKKDCQVSYQQKGRTMVVVTIFCDLESLEVEVKMGRLIKGK